MSEVNHPSPTIVTLFKDDSNINDTIRTTATTEITTDEGEETSSTEKQHTTTTLSANSSIMTTMPAAESPQTPSNSTDDNTSTNNKDESSPGFEEFLNVLKDEPKDIDKICTPNDDNNDNNNDDNIDYGSKPLERRRSSDLGNEMRASNLLNSTNTVDSWGNKAGSLPPLADNRQSSMPNFATTSKNLQGEEEEGSEISELDGFYSQPQDCDPARRSTWSQPPNKQSGGADSNVAQFVNINKLQPGSSQYYYSPANRSNRQLLEKVASKKKLKNKGDTLMDDSIHSRVSVLSERSRRSTYRGPTPVKKDGSALKGVMRRTSSYSAQAQPIEDPLSCPSAIGEPTVTTTGKLKRCSFSSVDIREHERIAGDNPCVTSGVPLSIGWGYYQHSPISLDDYELNRGPPRDKIEMMVPAGVRRQMLRDEFGVSVAEMNASMREVNVTKRLRRHTVATEHLEGWSEVVQSAKRKFSRFVKRTSTKKEEETIWAEAHKGALSEYLVRHGNASLGRNPSSPTPEVNQGPTGVSEDDNVPFTEISFQKDNQEDTPTF